MEFRTEQERFWAGDFGNEYISRNISKTYLASNLALFSRILSRVGSVGSVIEFGANVGMNLIAIKSLLPEVELSAVEINEKAVNELKKIQGISAHHVSILDFIAKALYDMVLVKGVLIHINPGELDNVYRKIFESSRKYILIAEYYNPTPIEVMYRGHQGKLYKRDFAGDMLEKYPGLRLVDYGFVYKRDPLFPQDDTTWFLLEKI